MPLGKMEWEREKERGYKREKQRKQEREMRKREEGKPSNGVMIKPGLALVHGMVLKHVSLSQIWMDSLIHSLPVVIVNQGHGPKTPGPRCCRVDASGPAQS